MGGSRRTTARGTTSTSTAEVRCGVCHVVPPPPRQNTHSSTLPRDYPVNGVKQSLFSFCLSVFYVSNVNFVFYRVVSPACFHPWRLAPCLPSYSYREGSHRAPRSYATVRGPRRSMARVGQRSEAAVLSSRPLSCWRCCQKADQLAASTCHECGSSVRATAAKRSTGSRTARPVRAEEAPRVGMSSHVHAHRPRAPCGRVLLL